MVWYGARCGGVVWRGAVWWYGVVRWCSMAACGVAAVDRRAFWRSSTPPLVPSVIYEDNHLLVLAKPACMPSVPDESGVAWWTTPLHTNMRTSRAPSPLLCIPALPLEVPPNSGSPPPSEHTHHDHHDLTAFLSPHPPGDHSLLEWGKAYTRKAYNKPGEASGWRRSTGSIGPCRVWCASRAPPKLPTASRSR